MKDAVGRALAIASTNGKRVAGDRRLLITALFLPLVIMFLVGGLFNSSRAKVAIGVADLDHGPLAAQLLRAFKASPALRVRHETSLSDGLRDLRRGVVLLVVQIPADYDGVLTSGGSQQVAVEGQPGQVASSEALISVTQLVDAQSSLVSGARAGGRAVDPSVALRAAPSAGVTQVNSTRKGANLLSPKVSPYSYTTPSNLVLFVFITSFVTTIRPIQDRKDGLTRRLLATPTPPVAIIGAELLAALLIAAGQAVALLAMGVVIFGVSWGNPLGLALLVLLVCLVGAGAGAALSTALSSQDQAFAVGIPLALVMGMLGGCMWPLEIVGPLTRQLGHLFPTAWAMDAFVTLIYNHGGLGAIGRDLLVLAAFAGGLITLATIRLRQVVIG